MLNANATNIKTKQQNKSSNSKHQQKTKTKTNQPKHSKFKKTLPVKYKLTISILYQPKHSSFELLNQKITKPKIKIQSNAASAN